MPIRKIEMVEKIGMIMMIERKKMRRIAVDETTYRY